MNLSCVVAECEQAHWFLGAAGVCNATTNRCDCPAGFSGRFILNPSETCHISHTLKVVFSCTALVVNIIALILNFAFISKVACQVKTLSRKSTIFPAANGVRRSIMVRSKGNSKICSGAQHFSQTELYEGKRRQTILNRKISVISVLACFCIYLVLNLARMLKVFLEVDAFAEELPPVWMMVYITADVGFVSGMSGFLYSFYKSLPNVSSLAQSVGIHCALSRYPSLIYYILHVNSLCLVGIFYAVGFLYITDAVEGFVENITTTLTVFYALLAFDLFAVYCMIYYLTIRLFRQILNTSKGRIPLSKVKLAAFRLNGTLAIGAGFVVYGIVTLILFLPAANHKFHFIIFTGFSIGCMNICVILGYWLARDYVKVEQGHNNPTTLRQTHHSETKQIANSKALHEAQSK